MDLGIWGDLGVWGLGFRVCFFSFFNIGFLREGGGVQGEYVTQGSKMFPTTP